MKFSKLIFIMSFFLFFSQLSFSLTFNEYLSSLDSDEIKQALLSDGKWTFFADTIADLKSTPKPFQDEIKKTLKGDSTLMIESIFVIDNTLKGLSKKDQLLKIENILRDITSLKGVEYFSPSRSQMRVLYEDSYAIANPKSDKPIANPFVTVYGGDPSRIFVYQKDLTFGANNYAWVYNTPCDYMSVYITNLTPMTYGIIKLVEPQNLRNLVFIYPLEDKILFYSVSTVKTVKFLGVEKSKTESFYQRMEAMFNWFKVKINS